MRIISFLLLALVLGTSMSCKKDSKRRIKKFHRKEVGSSAHDLLSDKDYKSITIELIYMTGYRPTDAAVENLEQLISSVCNKPSGVQVVFKEISAQAKSAYSIDDVKAIEDQERKEYTYKEDLAVCFIFLDGPSSENQGSSMVLGQAYYNTSMVIYEKTLRDHSGGFGEPELYKLETTVINHELGHILGLVNLGSTMYYAHQDSAHGAHCDNQDCLMYWEVETGSIFNNLIGNAPIPALDENCLKDLRENGGK
jgi:predicted Zn-dependent protease